jgi:hypothetical protein
VYLQNDETFGAWHAFDQNTTTIWHSDVAPINLYDANTGVYVGANGMGTGVNGYEILLANGQPIDLKGEWLMIYTSNHTPFSFDSYSITPNASTYADRAPNTWYVIGLNNNIWYEVDFQQHQSFNSANPKTYSVAYPGSYTNYALIILVVGNDAGPYNYGSDRYVINLAGWDLYSNSPDTSNTAMTNIQPGVKTSFADCKTIAANDGYLFFGINDVQPDGTGNCMVSNDVSKIQAYGQLNGVPQLFIIWSSNTAGTNGTMAAIQGDGTLVVKDSGGNILFRTTADPTCGSGYSYTAKADVPGNDLWAGPGTVDSCKQMCDENPSCNTMVMDTTTMAGCWLKNKAENWNYNNSTREVYQKLNPSCKY